MVCSSFVNLIQVFSKKEDRTVDAFAKLYESPETLKPFIEEAISQFLDKESLKGKNILLKPNWVMHDRNKKDQFCLRTHNNFILALLEGLLPIKPSKVTIGDSPIQSAIWDGIVSKEFVEKVSSLSKLYGIPVFLKDFRRQILLNNNRLIKNYKPISDFIIFDVGKSSFLEPVTPVKKKVFRIAHYDYKRLAEVHKPGVHKYCISKELFEADIIISIPKAKTHEKTGITAALKNLVGVNGDKDYLPHHRIGGTSKGGDSYPGNNIVRNFSERIMDLSNKTIGTPFFRYIQKLAILLWSLSNPGRFDQLGAAWYGNDTTWRMVLDLNLIVKFGRQDGTLSDKPQRVMYSLTDAIICGQGNGPLFPDSLPLGFLGFSNNAALNDLVFAELMNLGPNEMPLIKNAFILYPRDNEKIYLNGLEISIKDLGFLAMKANPAHGWNK